MEKASSFISSSEISEIIRFVIRAGLFLLSLLCMIGLTNFFVDPSHVYGDGSYERGIAEILASGKNVANVVDFDQKLVQRILIEKRRMPSDVVIIGSSRSMQIGSNIFPGANVMNNSISGATLDVYLSLLSCYDKKNLFPKKLILGFDPWVLMPDLGEEWPSLNGNELSILEKLGATELNVRPPLVPKRWQNIFSLAYFQVSAKDLFKRRLQANRYFSTDEERADYTILLRDGRRSYDKAFRSKSVQEVEGEVRDSLLKAERPAFQLGRMDPDWARVLEKAIVYLQGQGVDVVIFLPPQHPDVYKSFMGSVRNRVIVDTEAYFRELAQKRHLKIVGSYDPSRCGLTGADFYDAGHVTAEGVERIFSSAAIGM
ncbi:MAG: hypothetical protein HQL17_07455 [Candidatus Omnitrophica bacterium]|nr:hypothetical protein [Candidatus Omnitrophota bacterium]